MTLPSLSYPSNQYVTVVLESSVLGCSGWRRILQHLLDFLTCFFYTHNVWKHNEAQIWSKARKWVIQGACPLFSITILPFFGQRFQKSVIAPPSTTPPRLLYFGHSFPDLIRTSHLSIFVNFKFNDCGIHAFL